MTKAKRLVPNRRWNRNPCRGRCFEARLNSCCAVADMKCFVQPFSASRWPKKSIRNEANASNSVGERPHRLVLCRRSPRGGFGARRSVRREEGRGREFAANGCEGIGRFFSAARNSENFETGCCLRSESIGAREETPVARQREGLCPAEKSERRGSREIARCVAL